MTLNDENLAAVRDMMKIKKAYKLTSFGMGDGGKLKKPSEAQSIPEVVDKDLEIAVLGTMATRGAT